MKEINITAKDAGQRLDKYLKKYMPAAGSAFLYKMLRKKNITLNGRKAEGKEILAEKDCIRIFFSEETFAKMRGQNREGAAAEAKSGRGREAYRSLKEIIVVYEDEDLLFANKPAGILSQSDESGALSLNDWLLGYCRQQKKEDAFRPTVCNRLDRNTSGLVLCAKTYAGSRFLSDMIHEHKLRKTYLAVAEGVISGAGVLKGRLVKDRDKNMVQIIRQEDTAEGSLVETRYQALETKAGYTLLEVELITGKSHQIRAHLAQTGHPLAGDLKYGGHRWHGYQSQCLHAYRVVFPKIENAFGRISGRCFECGAPWMGEWNGHGS
ncbi:MAG: RluA family pseudouridine synthase [Lachnospiraceae bacterium]|nr:RluA family pseudouridine synthase [Lachnospiraceae bacterium]